MTELTPLARIGRRMPDWPADDLADLLAELDEAVTL